MKPILPCLAIFLLASALPAEAKLKGCYERVYDADHMDSHKNQRVRAMQMQLGFHEPNTELKSEDDMDYLAVIFLADDRLYYAGPQCTGTTCRTERDGESLTLAETKNGLTVTLESKLRVDEEGMGGEAGADILPNADHKVFALAKVSAEHCTYFYGK